MQTGGEFAADFNLNLFLVLAHSIVYETQAGERALGISPGYFQNNLGSIVGGYKAPNYALTSADALGTAEQAYTGTGAFSAMGSLPNIIERVQPQMDQISLQGTNDYLNGVNGTPGMLAEYQNAIAPAMSAIENEQAGANVNTVNQYAPAVMQALRAYNPQVTGTLDALNSQANSQLALNGALDPFTKTMLGQDIQSQQAARGMGTGYGDAAATAFYQDSMRQQLRAQNQQLASRVAGQTAGYYGDPFARVMGLAGGTGGVAGVFGPGGGGGGARRPRRSRGRLAWRIRGSGWCTGRRTRRSRITRARGTGSTPA